MIDKSIDVEKIAKMRGVDLKENSKLDMNELEMVTGGSDEADEIIRAFGTGFAMLYCIGYIVQHGNCPVCKALVPTSGDLNDKAAADIAQTHMETVHVK